MLGVEHEHDAVELGHHDAAPIPPEIPALLRRAILRNRPRHLLKVLRLVAQPQEQGIDRGPGPLS